MLFDESEWESLVGSDQKRWREVWLVMFSGDVMLFDESEWESLVGSDQKRWREVWLVMFSGDVMLFDYSMRKGCCRVFRMEYGLSYQLGVMYAVGFRKDTL